ncbi:MAG: HAD family phosphatase [Clostridia bacterium]|nr:HAD family phosphatase [Clostridia bacterium]
MKIKGAIFDMDGTLLDSIGVWDKIDYEYLAARGIEVPEDYARAISSLTTMECAEYSIKRFGLEENCDDLINEWEERALFEYAHNLELKPGAREYLEKLKSAGVKLALATSSSKRLYEAAMKHTGVYEMFDAFVTTDDTGKGKTDPEVYLTAAELLGVRIEECAVFEDVPHAVISAKKSGAYVCAVRDERWAADEEFLRGEADLYISDFREMQSGGVISN